MSSSQTRYFDPSYDIFSPAMSQWYDSCWATLSLSKLQFHKLCPFLIWKRGRDLCGSLGMSIVEESFAIVETHLSVPERKGRKWNSLGIWPRPDRGLVDFDSNGCPWLWCPRKNASGDSLCLEVYSSDAASWKRISKERVDSLLA